MNFSQEFYYLKNKVGVVDFTKARGLVKFQSPRVQIESKAEDNFSASSTQLYILAGVYLACSILSAIVVAVFVDPLSK